MSVSLNQAAAGPSQGGRAPSGGRERSELGASSTAGPSQGGRAPSGGRERSELGVSDACAIDFGTSNSAIAVGGVDGTMQLVPLEGGQLTLPTAVFYLAEGPELHNLPRRFGRAAMAAYVEGLDGRLMRSLKSCLGTGLMDQATDIGAGRNLRFAEVIAAYLAHLKATAEAACGRTLRRVVMGRPVFFVDDDPVRDASAQAALEAAARAVGFDEVVFQFEPIAAALHYEQTVTAEQHVLVADIGGGTSDFSLVRVRPGGAAKQDRRDDVLASHGVHIAGTDFDRRLSLAGPMRALGLGTFGPSVQGAPPREVPSRIYHDLATWHLINTLYSPQRLAELRALKTNFADPKFYQRLNHVVLERLGHELAGQTEAAKIAVAAGGETEIDLSLVEARLAWPLTAAQADAALQVDVDRIVQAAIETVRLAGLVPDQVDALYFTGGSTGLKFLVQALQAPFSRAQSVQGDRLASVATGLGLHAESCFSH